MIQFDFGALHGFILGVNYFQSDEYHHLQVFIGILAIEISWE